MQGFKNALIYVEGKGIIKTNLGELLWTIKELKKM